MGEHEAHAAGERGYGVSRAILESSAREELLFEPHNRLDVRLRGARLLFARVSFEHLFTIQQSSAHGMNIPIGKPAATPLRRHATGVCRGYTWNLLC
jgi:hypothetical protein